MNNIYGITVSKNYSDFLYYSIKKNHTLFRKWYIVTQEDDEDTIALINDFNLDNIELLFYPLVPDLCLAEHQQMPFVGDDAFLINDNPNLRLLPPKYKKVIFDKGGAIRFVQSKREVANPNSGFVGQLRKYQREMGYLNLGIPMLS